MASSLLVPNIPFDCSTSHSRKRCWARYPLTDTRNHRYASVHDTTRLLLYLHGIAASNPMGVPDEGAEMFDLRRISPLLLRVRDFERMLALQPLGLRSRQNSDVVELEVHILL